MWMDFFEIVPQGGILQKDDLKSVLNHLDVRDQKQTFSWFINYFDILPRVLSRKLWVVAQTV